MPLQGLGYGVKEPPQGLLAATVLVEQIRPPDGRAEALLGGGGKVAGARWRGVGYASTPKLQAMS